MRKQIIFIILVMAVVLVLAGCGTEPANEVPDQVMTPDIEEEDVVAVEPKEEPEEEVVEETGDEVLSNPFENINNMDEYYYEVESTTNEQTFTTKLWTSGNRMKMESLYPETGESIIMVMDGEKGLLYMYQPSENTTIIMDLDTAPSSIVPDDEGNINYIDAMKKLSEDGSVIVEKGTFEGEPVQIITGEVMENKNIIWISTKTGFPLKAEYYENGTLFSSSLFKAFNNEAIDSSIFDIPEGTQVMDLRKTP